MKIILITLLMSLSLLCFNSSADRLLIDIVRNAPEISKPSKGMTKTQVEKTFGKPIVAHAPVGKPPISNWEYDKFTVYFEYNHVIHAVINR